jgi:predicted AAA+ superfamily ATPase
MLHEHESFPVGKVEFLNIFPMSFDEFLRAREEDELSSFVHESPPSAYRTLHEKLLHRLREYIYVGGMPAVVASHVTDRAGFGAVRAAQETILRAYGRDFSKYAASLADY